MDRKGLVNEIIDFNSDIDIKKLTSLRKSDLIKLVNSLRGSKKNDCQLKEIESESDDGSDEDESDNDEKDDGDEGDDLVDEIKKEEPVKPIQEPVEKPIEKPIKAVEIETIKEVSKVKPKEIPGDNYLTTSMAKIEIKKLMTAFSNKLKENIKILNKLYNSKNMESDVYENTIVDMYNELFDEYNLHISLVTDEMEDGTDLPESFYNIIDTFFDAQRNNIDREINKRTLS